MKTERTTEMNEERRVLSPLNHVAVGLKLTQRDYDAAAPYIPDDVLPNSGAEDGWVYGIKYAIKHPMAAGPNDPNAGGSIYSEIVKAFQAYRKG